MGKRVPIYEKALLDALFLTLRNLAVPKLVVKQQSNNDVHGYDIYNICIFIQAWASALLVSTTKAMPELRRVG